MPKKSRRKMLFHSKRNTAYRQKKEAAKAIQAASEDNPTPADNQPSYPSPGMEQSSVDILPHQDLLGTEQSPQETCQDSSQTNTPRCTLTQSVVSAVIRKLNCTLPSDWVCSADSKGFYILRLSSGIVKAVQRQVFVSFLGNAKAYLHCQPCLILNEAFKWDHTPTKLSLETIDQFCRSITSLVNIVMKYSVCVGANNPEAHDYWSSIPHSEVDSNPYFEPYTSEDQGKTLRSTVCSKLILANSYDVRCEPCSDIMKTLEDRIALSVY